MWFLPPAQSCRADPATARGPSASRALPLLLAGFALYAGYFIYRTSFVIDGRRWFSLFDDAMVSMRFARNLAEGHGLVWNPGGPRVEGFTNPLWVGMMALPHLLRLSESKISLFIQLAGAACLVLNLILTARLARRLVGTAWSVAAVALTA